MNCNYYFNFLDYSDYFNISDKSESLELLIDLRKLERILLKSFSELDKTILIQFLDHQDSLILNFKHLELQFCNFNSDIIAKLIQQVSSSLTHVILLFKERINTMN